MKKITVQFVMDEQGLVNFVNPCCEMMEAEYAVCSACLERWQGQQKGIAPRI